MLLQSILFIPAFFAQTKDLLRMLRAGATEWNSWRAANPSTQKIYLTGSNLTGLDLRSIDFAGVQLTCSDMSNADLTGANLCAADLSQCKAVGTTFADANLSNATLALTDARAAIFKGANMVQARMMNMRLVGANFTWSDLRGVDFTWSDLSEADLTGADIAGTVFRKTRTNGMNLCLTKNRKHASFCNLGFARAA